MIMDMTEKLARMRVLIAPAKEPDELLMALLNQAGDIVIGRRWPFGPPMGATVPNQYGSLQIQIAIDLYSKMGAEGEIAHTENGITRTYEAADVSPSLLRQIMPLVGGVVR